MKFISTIITTAVMGGSVCAQAAPSPIISLTLTNANFCMDGSSSGTTCMATGSNGEIGDGAVAGVNGSYNIVSGYHGGGAPYPSANPASIIHMMFFGAPANTYTAASNLGADNSPAGTIPGGPVPSGLVDFEAGTISLDMSSWFWNYQNSDQYQGSAMVTGTVTGGLSSGGTFDVIWSSVLSGGAVDGFTGTWRLQGNVNVTAVPEASPYTLMLAGLGLVGGGVARRRSNDNKGRTPLGL